MLQQNIYLTSRLLKMLISLVFPVVILVEGLSAQNCGTMPEIVAEWNFDSKNGDCNGADGETKTTPSLKQNDRFYCPNTNAGCAGARLGSQGHSNTTFFNGAICLLGFFDTEESVDSKGGCPFDDQSTVFDPEQCNNLYLEYTIPKGTTGCLTGFDVTIMQKQFDGSTVFFEKQGVAIKKNGVLVYQDDQTITASQINDKTSFVFTGGDLCSDGSSDVTFTVLFGLVHLLTEPGKVSTAGYDNIILYGTCGGPSSPGVEVTQATCLETGPANNGMLTLRNFDPNARFDFNSGTSYSGSATYGTANMIPGDGIIADTLVDNGMPRDFTIRIFNADGCYTDLFATIPPVNCPKPEIPCTAPSGMKISTTLATCTGDVANADAEINVTNVIEGDRAAYSIGNSFSGDDYNSASSINSGGITFSGLANPTGSQIYTVRTYNGADDCYTDRLVILEDADCGPCSNSLVEIINSGANDPDSAPGNGEVSEDDALTFEICRSDEMIDIELSKTVSPSSGMAGITDFVWTITVQNTGTMTATNVQIKDLLPEESLALTSSNPSIGTFGLSAGWLVGDLAAGATATLELHTTATDIGIFENCVELVSASPDNDPDSTPDNNLLAEDDQDCESITVTGIPPPTVEKEFSPELVKTGVAFQMSIKIQNNHTEPITLQSDLIDMLPNNGGAGQMEVASVPNIVSDVTGVIALAGATDVTIPAGSTLLPGFSVIQVDVIVNEDGEYCNRIEAGDLETDAGNNALATEICMVAKSTYVMAPILQKSFDPAVTEVGEETILTISIDNRNSSDFTLLQDFVDDFPIGMIATGGACSGFCAGLAPLNAGDETLILLQGTTIPPGISSISVPVTSNQEGILCNRIPINAMIVEAEGVMVPNEGIAESCATFTNTPCTDISSLSLTIEESGPYYAGDTVTVRTSATGTDAFTIYEFFVTGGNLINSGASPARWILPATEGDFDVLSNLDNSATGHGTCLDNETTRISVELNEDCVPGVCPTCPSGLSGACEELGSWDFCVDEGVDCLRPSDNSYETQNTCADIDIDMPNITDDNWSCVYIGNGECGERTICFPADAPSDFEIEATPTNSGERVDVYGFAFHAIVKDSVWETNDNDNPKCNRYPQEFTVVVTEEGNTLTQGVDYTVSDLSAPLNAWKEYEITFTPARQFTNTNPSGDDNRIVVSVEGANFVGTGVCDNDEIYEMSCARFLGCCETSTCDLTASGSATACDDEGTGDPDDDTFTVTLNPTGSGLGSTYSVSGDITANNVSYGSAQQVGGSFPISGGNLTITITDDATGTCQIIDEEILAPSPCSTCVPGVCPTCPNGLSGACEELGSWDFCVDEGVDCLRPSDNSYETQNTCADIDIDMPNITDDNWSCVYIGDGECGERTICFPADAPSDFEIEATPTNSGDRVDVYGFAFHAIVKDEVWETNNNNNPKCNRYPQEFTVVVTEEGNTLTQGVDYTVSDLSAPLNVWKEYEITFTPARQFTNTNPSGDDNRIVVSVEGANFVGTGVCDNDEIYEMSCARFLGCCETSTCDLTASGSATACDDEGTGDPSDDTFTVTLNPIGSGLGSTYSVSGDITANNVSYGSAQQVGGSFPISGGNLTITITDDATGTCQLVDEVIVAPSPCSTCNLTASGSTTNCDDENTSDENDDTFTVTLNPTGSGLGSTYSVSGDITMSNVSYGSAQQVGGIFLISDGDLTITITDDATGTCQLVDEIIVAPSPCSMACPPNEHTICDDDSNSAQLMADPGYTNYIWYEYDEVNMVRGVQVGTGQILTVVGSDVGTAGSRQCYVYSADGFDGCPFELCCPVCVITEECCPASNCHGVQVEIRNNN